MKKLKQAVWPYTEDPSPPSLAKANRSMAVYWLLEERERQEQRWSENHDNSHTDQDWSVLLAQLSLEDKYSEQIKYARVAATALAALEAHIRFKQSVRAPGPEEGC